MEQTGFIACIDFGTSNIIGLLGRRNEQDVISIIASESIPADSSVKHGIVYNIDEAAGKIKKLLSLLENKVGKKIGKVYVSIAGMSLRAIEHLQTQRLEMPTTITFAMIDKMEQQAKQNKPALLTNYSVVAPEVFLDSIREEDYLNKTASTLEIRYRLIAGRPNIKSNLQKAIIEKNKIDIAGYIVGPVATGAILLNEDDKQKGCVLVDFGGGTTTVSVYKDGLLRFMSVIPFGGRTITKDIQSLGVTFDNAESYKIRYGNVGKDKTKGGQDAPDSSVNLRELNKIIQLRQEEIVMNVVNQINESGYAAELEAGIITTGGASQLKGLNEYLADKSRMLVKSGSIERLYINNATDLLQNPSYSQCLGLMLFAKENCEKTEPRPQPINIQPENINTTINSVQDTAIKTNTQVVSQPQADDTDDKRKKEKKSGGIFKFLNNFGGTLFDDEE